MSLESAWSTVEEFTDNLNDAMSREMATIRETDLGLEHFDFQEAYLLFAESPRNRMVSALVDKFGRVILPPHIDCDGLLAVASGPDPEIERRASRKVVRLEPRYEGDKKSALVIYLESGEEG